MAVSVAAVVVADLVAGDVAVAASAGVVLDAASATAVEVVYQVAGAVAVVAGIGVVSSMLLLWLLALLLTLPVLLLL